MDFETLCWRLKERLAMPLPGEKAHDIFRATPVGDVRPDFRHKDPPRPGAVMVLLYDHEGVRFPLIKRPEYKGHHGGQVSLPGGKAEPGEDAVQTALRETEEEIGISSEEVRILGKLSNFFVIPSNFMVTPIIAACQERPAFRPDPYEVAAVLEARIDELVSGTTIRRKEILAAGKYRLMAPHFEIESEVVWGATAMMLNEFREVILDIEGDSG